MRILLATSAEKGHLNPMVGVAQWLLHAGHEVGWLCLPEPPPQLAALGVEPLCLPTAFADSPGLVTGGEALARLVRDPPALRAWIRGLLLDAVPAQVAPARAVIRGFRPAVIASDGMLYAVVIAAALESIRCAGMSSALTLLPPPGLDHELIRTVRALAPRRASLFAEYGMAPEFRTCEWLSPLLNVVFATPALVGADAAVPPRTQLVGPSVPRGPRGDEPGFPWAWLDPARPLIYVSFGSQISWQPELFRQLADATTGLGAQVVLTAGGLADTPFATALPDHVLAVRYAPQLALLARARVFVSHGGANSVMEAMSHGVPMLLLPVCNDQPVQAYFIERAGAGRALDPFALDTVEFRAVLQDLMASDSPARQHARRIQADYAQHAGARTAATLLASLR